MQGIPDVSKGLGTIQVAITDVLNAEGRLPLGSLVWRVAEQMRVLSGDRELGAEN